jgi:hypothetical protein
MEGKTYIADFPSVINSFLTQCINMLTSTLVFFIANISAGNIMITYDGKGLLIDWDLCVRPPSICARNGPSFRGKIMVGGVGTV